MTRGWPPQRDPLRDGYVLVSALFCLAIGTGLLGELGLDNAWASDAAGWHRYRLPDPYEWTDYASGIGFYFTPPIAFLIYPLTLLPIEWFSAVWTGVQLGALYGLVGRWAGLAILFPPVWWEIHAGNITLLIALAAVWAVKAPALWSFVYLTKITPGIAALWHVVRGEWREVGLSVAATGVVTATAVVIAPGLWTDWFNSLASNIGQSGPGFFTIPISLPVRVMLAALIVTWGARSGRVWVIPVATSLASPVLWYNALAPLVAVPFLWGHRLDTDREVRRPPGFPG